MREHIHKWKFKKTVRGVVRKCRCGEKYIEIAVPKGSSLDREFKELPKKGQHRKK